MLKEALANNSPAFAACDGGKKTTTCPNNKIEEMTKTRASAAAVLFCTPIESNDNEMNQDWTDSNPEPMLIRTSKLPSKMGTTMTDNDIGEMQATNMIHEMLPITTPIVTTTDSETARNANMNMRDEQFKTKRELSRIVQGGASKSLAMRLHNNVRDRNRGYDDKGATLESKQQMKAISKRVEKLASTTEDRPWKRKCYDEDLTQPSFKVDSHQLTATATGRPTKRCKTLSPSNFFAQANQHADNGANIGIGQIQCKSTTVSEHVSTPAQEVIAPPGPRHCITHGGRRIDKDMPREVEITCHNEVKHKGMMAATQGHVLRACPFIQGLMRCIGNHSTASRMINGAATTHAQKLHANKEHKECHMKHLGETTIKPSNSTQQLMLQTDEKCKNKEKAENTKLRMCPFCLNDTWNDEEKLPGPGNARRFFAETEECKMQGNNF